jgi:glycosyltransferase involved in cell wall biosynthesis
MKFSACWIVKNEEENIERSIASVKEIADELIVVDTGSTDGTVQAAVRCGARVGRFDWVNDFSAARNYALSLAKGEFVVFLDADEYFYPSLTAADGEKLMKIFEETKADVLELYSVEIEKEGGFLCGVRIRTRILRRAAVHYEGRIHEIPMLADGGEPEASLLENYKMVHTGSSVSVIPQKIKRNLEILEEEQKSIDDPLSRYLNAIYLIQDAFFNGDIYKAADYCLYLFAHHEHHADAYNSFPAELRKFFYTAVHVVEMKRGEFNRREAYDKLFRAFKEHRAGRRDGMLTDLHYQLRFDYRDDRFLTELDEVMPKLPAGLSDKTPDSQLIEAKIFNRAAEAAHMRGDSERTCLYASRALDCTQSADERLLLLLLYSLNNLPAEAAVLPSHPDIAAEVNEIINVKGFRERLFENAKPLEIFPPEVRRASEDGNLSIRQDIEKLFAGMRYADIVNYPDAELAAENNFICAYYLAYAYLMLEDYNKAYDIIIPHINSGAANQELLSVLLVVAEKAKSPLADEAKEFYESLIAMLSETVDLLDVVSTGAVYKADPAEETRVMKSIKPSDFIDGYQYDKGRPATELLLTAHMKAAPVFVQNNCVLMAALSLRFLLAKGHEPEQNAESLRELFKSCGNEAVAEQISTRVTEPIPFPQA